MSEDVVRFSSTGRVRVQWGSFGSGEGQFHTPQGIAVDRFGEIYVADSMNDRIQRYSPAAPSAR